MSLESSILRHPSSVQLMEYAESLVDDDSPVCVLIAAHLKRCPDCAAEVAAIQQSLKLTALAALPESSQTLSQAILLQAKKEASRPKETVHSFRWYPLLRGVACLLAIVLLAAISFSAALQEGSEVSSIAVQAEARPIPTPEHNWTPARFSGSVVQALAASITFQGNALSKGSDSGQRRIVDFLDQDLDAALAALERNPGCVRATQIVDSEAQKRLEGLRTLFVDRTL